MSVTCATCHETIDAPGGAPAADVCPHCGRFAHPTRLRDYDDIALIGRGGMGTVFRARHARLGTVVAIKLLHVGAATGPAAARFEREARLAARIPHPGVVRVFDADCHDGRLWLVMEFVDGATLRGLLRDGPLPIDRAVDTAAQLLDVLGAAHGSGIVHRDVKPENVMVDRTGRVRVLDFGISRVPESDERLTQTGELLGTPEYMAPEQILDAPDAVDHRADVHATGVLLYEMLTGRSPFAGAGMFQALKRVEALVPPPPSTLRPDVPTALDAIVMSMLEKDKDDRPADAAALAARLRASTGADADTEADKRARPPRATRTNGRRLAAGLGLLAIGVAAGWALGSWRVAADAPVDRTGDGTQAASVRTIACGQLRDGAWIQAMEALRRARDGGDAAAAREWRVAWLYVNRLYPALLPGAPWLAARDDRFPDSGTPFDRALAALARNEWSDARALLNATNEGGRTRVVLAALCSHLLGDAPPASPPTDDAAGVVLAALAAPRTARAERLERLATRIDRHAPMRYFFEIAAAAARRDVRRLRAATELAVVTGESPRATSVFLACRAASMPSPTDAATLLVVAGEPTLATTPGIAATRAVLATAARDAHALREALAALPDAADPTVAHLLSLRATRTDDDATLLAAAVEAIADDDE